MLITYVLLVMIWGYGGCVCFVYVIHGAWGTVSLICLTVGHGGACYTAMYCCDCICDILFGGSVGHLSTWGKKGVGRSPPDQRGLACERLSWGIGLHEVYIRRGEIVATNHGGWPVRGYKGDWPIRGPFLTY